MKNSYAVTLRNGPEFFCELSNAVPDSKLIEDFTEKSKYYCYKLKLDISEVIYDKKPDMDNSKKDEYLVHRICRPLADYSDAMKSSDDLYNDIIRAGDNVVINDKCIIDKIEITNDMIRKKTALQWNH